MRASAGAILEVVLCCCYEFSFLWVGTYPDICLAVIEIETGEIYGEGWIRTVTNGMLMSSYKGLQLAIYFNFTAK